MPIRSTHTKRQLDEVTCVHPNAAGFDIGRAEIVVTVPAERAPPSVHVFRTFSPDLHALVAWRITCDIDTVAIESTVVFWIPIYELLEAVGITPIWSTRGMSRLGRVVRPNLDQSAAEYDHKRRERERKHLERRAQKLGYTLTAVSTTALESPPEPGGSSSF